MIPITYPVSSEIHGSKATLADLFASSEFADHLVRHWVH